MLSYSRLLLLMQIVQSISIPDFIPFWVILMISLFVPLGITLALQMIPLSVIEDFRIRAKEMGKNGKPKNWVAGAILEKSELKSKKGGANDEL